MGHVCSVDGELWEALHCGHRWVESVSAVRLRLVQSSRCEEHCPVFEEFDGEKEAGDGARTRRHRAQDVRPAHVVRLVRFFVREVEGRANVNAAPKHDDADDVDQDKDGYVADLFSDGDDGDGDEDEDDDDDNDFDFTDRVTAHSLKTI